MWFITVAIKYVLENMYCRYITSAKKLKKMTYCGALKTTGIGYGHMPYTSGSQSAGIGRTYCGGLKTLV